MIRAASMIARLDGASYEWFLVGLLNQGRLRHNVIYLNGHFLVVGGGTDSFPLKTEKCVYRDNKVICDSQAPLLFMYSENPELMIVPHDYCGKKTILQSTSSKVKHGKVKVLL